MLTPIGEPFSIDWTAFSDGTLYAATPGVDFNFPSPDPQVTILAGQTTPDEREALSEEGIEVMSLPIPAALKGPVQ